MEMFILWERQRHGALEAFGERIHRDKCHIEALSKDWGQANFAIIIDNLPGVPSVFERVHVVKL